MPKQIAKYEERFGKLKTQKDAQKLADKAKLELVRRKQELLKELSKRVSIDDKDRNLIYIRLFGEIKIPIAEIKAFLNFETSETILFIDRLSVGEFLSDYEQDIHFKETDPLRGLNIGQLLLMVVKAYAKRKRIDKIKLVCKKELFPFYKRAGFEIEEPFEKNKRIHQLIYLVH